MINGFPWARFFIRTVGGYAAVTVWIVQDARRHDSLGILFAMLTATAVTFIGYRWTLRSVSR